MERKQLLGAVFDEIEHYFKLHAVERKVHLALAAVAGLCLIAGLVLLILRPAGHPAMAAAVLGAAGLIAFAAARSTVFFHATLALVEETVKRYSKLTDPEIVSTVETLKRKSSLSLTLVAAGAAAVIFSVGLALVRVAEIGNSVEAATEDAERARIDAERWKQSFAGSQQAYATLKDSVAALYGAQVTQAHQLVAVRVTADKAATPRGAPPNYVFSMALQSTPQTLSSIRSVRYEIQHVNAEAQVLASEDPGAGFKASFAGTACAPRIDIALTMQDGTGEAFSVDQCRALGAPWAAPAAVNPAPT
jgi:hypothetical protein